MRVARASAPAAAEHEGEEVGSLVVGGGGERGHGPLGTVNGRKGVVLDETDARIVVRPMAEILELDEGPREVAKIDVDESSPELSLQRGA